MGRPGRRWFILGFIPLVGVVLLPVVTSLAAEQLPSDRWWVWPAVVALAAPMILAQIAQERRRRVEALAGGDDVLAAQAADGLAEAVAAQWQAEAASRLLNRPEPIRLRWRATARPVAMAAPTVRSGVVGELAERLLATPVRQMVVLGVAGSGKSAAALLITLDLLRYRGSGDDDAAVPVPVNLSSWRPHEENLFAWLTRRLGEDYPGLAGRYGHEVLIRLLRRGFLLPVLDGLDEIPVSFHAAAIEGVDLATAAGMPFVLTCRADAYEQAVTGSGQVLSRAIVVELQPVELEAAQEYLGHSSPNVAVRWEELFRRLAGHESSPVIAVLSTPLMVWLARVVYSDPVRDPMELTDVDKFPDAATVQAYLLDAYLPAVYSHRPATAGSTSRYQPDRVRRWLGFIAGQLHGGGTYELAWWRLDRTGRRTPLALAFVTAFVFLYPSIGFDTDAFAYYAAMVLSVIHISQYQKNAAGRAVRGPLCRWFGLVLSGLGAGAGIAAARYLAEVTDAWPGSGLRDSAIEVLLRLVFGTVGYGLLVALGAGLAVPTRHRCTEITWRERIVTALFGGTISALFAAGSAYPISMRPATVLPAGLSGLLLAAVFYSPLAKLLAPMDEPRRIVMRLRGQGRHLRRMVVRGAAFGPVIGAQLAVLSVALSAGRFSSLGDLTDQQLWQAARSAGSVVAFGAGGGLLWGLLWGLARVLSEPAGDVPAADPLTLLRMDRRACLLAAALAGIATMTTYLLIQAPVPGEPMLWNVRLVVDGNDVSGAGIMVQEALTCAAAVAVAVAWRFSWPRFALGRLRAALTGRLPLRLMAFAKDAHQRGVLRQTGGLYQFRHSRLQDHLAGKQPDEQAQVAPLSQAPVTASDKY